MGYILKMKVPSVVAEDRATNWLAVGSRKYREHLE